MDKEAIRRYITVERIKPKDAWDSYVYRIAVDNENITEWNDSANIDYPEDLCWHRVISRIFNDGVKAGILATEKYLQNMEGKNE